MIAWLVEALTASAALMLLVLLLRGPVRRQFGPAVGYALWLLPLLRLALPPLPAAWRAAAATPISQAGETITVLVIAPTGTAIGAAAPAMQGPPIGVLLLGVWAGGAVLFLGWHAARHWVFCRRLLAGAVPMARHGRIRVVESPAAAGPLAFGIWRRYVAFPRDFAARYDRDERELALAHELGHHVRGDLLANWAALIVLALHWFNPVAWRAFRAFRADQELANDARVLAGRSMVDRHAYACAIVKTAHGCAFSAACHLHAVQDLKGRLKMLTTSRTSHARIAAGAASVGALVLAGLGLTASGTQAAERIRTATGIDLSQVAPTPPIPPVAAVPAIPATPPVGAKKGNRHHVVVVQNGRRTEYAGADADAYVAAHPVPPVPAVPPMPSMAPMPAMASMPEVSSRSCADGQNGGPRQFVIHQNRGEKRFVIVCANRVQAATAEGARMGANSAAMQRDAMAKALVGLDQARSNLAAAGMSDADRKAALAGIEDARRELRAEMGERD